MVVNEHKVNMKMSGSTVTAFHPFLPKDIAYIHVECVMWLLSIYSFPYFCNFFFRGPFVEGTLPSASEY